MIRYNINLSKYRLRVEFGKTRRRAGYTPLFPSLETLRGTRAGSKVSRVARHILERSNIKAILGANLAAFVALTGVLAPVEGALAAVEPEMNTITLSEQPIATEVTVQYPTRPVIINQGYHYFHWGVDLDGVTGDPIWPIMKGRVVRTESSRWGYGNTILVDHGDGLQSFYAHLSKANSREGDEVDTRTVIGEVGSTGRSTGDHLHLEVYKNGRPVNPRAVIGR